MTGATSRRRGADAERAVVAYLRENGAVDARRYLAGDGKQPGDIDAFPGVVIEVKDQNRACYPAWCRQAAVEAGPDRIWAVVRRTRGRPDVGMWPCVVSREWWIRHSSVFPSYVDRLSGDFAAGLERGRPVVADQMYAVTRFWRFLGELKENGA